MTWQSTLLRDHPLVGRICDASLGRDVRIANVIESLKRSTFSLLGEVHDNADHHAIQAGLLEGIARSGVRRAVVFEQFDREYEPELKRLISRGQPAPEDVADAVGFDRKGWNWEFYRPLVEIALRHRMPIAAGNLSRNAGATIARQGLGALDPARITALRLDSGWSAERESALEKIIADGHCGMLPAAALPAMVVAQRARDATLAEAMLEYAREGAVLITGNGHVRRDLSTPIYLATAAPDAACCSVGILEVQDGRNDPAAYLASAVANVRPYDFVFFTPRRDRPDPCLAFRKK